MGQSQLLQAFTVDRLQVQVYPSAAELSQAAAEFVQGQFQAILQQEAQVNAIAATGNSQVQFLEKLTQLPNIDWSRVVFFHLDEYMGISGDHPASFRRYLQQRIADQVPLKQFHYLQGDSLEPVAECDRYAQLLQQQSLHLCFLGLGENGHLAYNEPSVANFTDPYGVKLIKLDAETRQVQVKKGDFPNLMEVPQYAFTLTLPTICRAKTVICLAFGQNKAKAIKALLTEAIHPNCPASILRTHPQAILLLDQSAAAAIV